jgi:hypothetical protein
MGESIVSAEKIMAWESCPRRFAWQVRYAALRISPIRALYIALDVGLRTEKDPEKAAENRFLALAASPGLDITGHDVYQVAMHYSKLAGILAMALRSAWSEPWEAIEVSGWVSGCYRTGDGMVRRLALVDRWSDDRKQQEVYSWRTIAESVMLDQPILLTAISIGSSHDKRRHSPWTRCYRHPRNKTFRMQRKTSEEDFSQTWGKTWREDSGIPTADWLTQMRKDGCMEDLVHTVHFPVPKQKGEYLAQIGRYVDEMANIPDHPPMRLSGCYGFSPCPFTMVCHGAKPPVPESYGFSLSPFPGQKP